MQLPPELLGLIIGHLHNNSSALRACATASHAFLPYCQAHLFSRITIQSYCTGVGNRYIPYFTSLTSLFVCMTPHLAQFIQDLRILESSVITAPHPARRLDEETFIRILENFPRLSTLHLDTFGFNHAWEGLSDRIQAAFLALFVQPSVNRLHLAQRPIPPSLFCSLNGKGIDHLSLHSVEIHPGSNSTSLGITHEEPSFPRMSIRTLNVHLPLSEISLLNSAIDFTHLSQLTLRLEDGRGVPDYSGTWELLQACSPTLTHLSIYPSLACSVLNSSYDSQPIDLSRLTSLRSLHLMTKIGTSRFGCLHFLNTGKDLYRNPFPWVTHLLGTLNDSHSMIEDLTIIFSLARISDLEECRRGGLAMLDDTLTHPAMLRIKKISLQAYIEDSRPEYSMRERGLLRKGYSRIVENVFPKLWETRGEKLGVQILDETPFL